MPNGKCLNTSQAAYHEIPGVMVIAGAVASRKERLAGILRSQESELQAVAVVEAVAYGMLVGIAQIAVAVALALVEGDVQRGCHLLLSPVPQAVQTGKLRLCRPMADVGEGLQQLAMLHGERRNHLQLAPRQQLAVTVAVGDDVLHLLVGKKGQRLQFLTGGAVDVERLTGKLVKQLVSLLPGPFLKVLRVGLVVERLLPVVLSHDRLRRQAKPDDKEDIMFIKSFHELQKYKKD